MSDFNFNKKKYDFDAEDITGMDDLGDTDIKINPDYYIHSAILKAQASLTKENVKDGFLQFSMLVEHIEDLCRAANKVPENYEARIKERFPIDANSTVDMVRKANYKLRLLMSEFFSSKFASEPLKI